MKIKSRKQKEKAILSRLLIKDNDDDLFHYAAADALPFVHTQKQLPLSPLSPLFSLG